MVSTLKVVFVTETNSVETRKECQRIAATILYEMSQKKILEVVEESELQMFEKIDMKEVQHCLISQHTLDQYTSYNFPLIEAKLYSSA